MKEKIRLKINEQEHELPYEEQLQCSEETINEDLQNQPSLFAWYAVLEELAEAELQEAKLALDLVEAELDAHYRSTLEKVTETKISNKIKSSEEYIKAKVAVNEARKKVGILKAIREAFSHRKDMLIALASNMRAQADPEIFIRKEKVKKDLANPL